MAFQPLRAAGTGYTTYFELSDSSADRIVRIAADDGAAAEPSVRCSVTELGIPRADPAGGSRAIPSRTPRLSGTSSKPYRRLPADCFHVAVGVSHRKS